MWDGTTCSFQEACRSDAIAVAFTIFVLHGIDRRACLVATILICAGTWWSYVLLTSFAIVGSSSLVVAWSPNIGGEVISFVSNATEGYLDFVLDLLEGLLET